MKLKEALKLEREHFEKRMKLRTKKGKDYATEADVLSNFKVMAALQKTLQLNLSKPSHVALWHLLHKLVRIVNLTKKEVEPENESLEDTYLDGNNYIDLSKECYLDEQREPKTMQIFPTSMGDWCCFTCGYCGNEIGEDKCKKCGRSNYGKKTLEEEKWEKEQREFYRKNNWKFYCPECQKNYEDAIFAYPDIKCCVCGLIIGGRVEEEKKNEES